MHNLKLQGNLVVLGSVLIITKLSTKLKFHARISRIKLTFVASRMWVKCYLQHAAKHVSLPDKGRQVGRQVGREVGR